MQTLSNLIALIGIIILSFFNGVYIVMGFGYGVGVNSWKWLIIGYIISFVLVMLTNIINSAIQKSLK